MKQERKVVTRGAVPQTREPEEVPGSLDAMINCGERPPELVLLAVVKILNHSLSKCAGEGYIVELDSVYGHGGMSSAVAGAFDNPGEALDAVSRLVRSACQEAEEFCIDPPLPKG